MYHQNEHLRNRGLKYTSVNLIIMYCRYNENQNLAWTITRKRDLQNARTVVLAL